MIWNSPMGFKNNTKDPITIFFILRGWTLIWYFEELFFLWGQNFSWIFVYTGCHTVHKISAWLEKYNDIIISLLATIKWSISYQLKPVTSLIWGKYIKCIFGIMGWKGTLRHHTYMSIWSCSTAWNNPTKN